MATGPDGSVYFFDQTAGTGSSGILRRLHPSGVLETLAGWRAGMPGPNPGVLSAADGVEAFDGTIPFPDGLTVMRDGTPVFLFRREGSWYQLRALVNGRILALGGHPSTIGNAGIHEGPALSLNLLSGTTGGQSLARMSDGSVLLPGRGCIRRLAASDTLGLRDMWGLSGDGTEVHVASEDGAKIYIFDLDGRHLRTDDAVSGTPIDRFEYDSAGRLESIEDAAGNLTTLLWPTGSGPLRIQGPFGHETELHFDSEGYLEEVIAPDAARWEMSYHHASGSMLASFTDPLDRRHDFFYEDGLLERDEGPGDAETPPSVTTLEETILADGVSVERRTAEDRFTHHAVRHPRPNQPDYEALRTEWGRVPSQIRERIDEAGFSVMAARFPDGSAITRRSDGSEDHLSDLRPDPRFGMDSAYAAQAERRLPDGRGLCASRERSLDGDELLETITEWEAPPTIACADATSPQRVTMRLWDFAARTLTTTTPEGRVHSAEWDPLGRVTRSGRVGLAPTDASYDTLGRLETLSSTVGPSSRATTLAYHPTLGHLSSLDDGAGRSVEYERDAFGRATEVSVGDGVSSASTLFGWDAAGNLAALTPPDRPAHAHAHTPRDELRRHETPEGTGNEALRLDWAYDADGRLVTSAQGLYEQGLLQSEQVSSRSYFDGDPSGPVPPGSRGRLQTLTFPTDPSSPGASAATLDYTYHPHGTAGAGRVATLSRSDGASLSLSWLGGRLTEEAYTLPGPSPASVGYAYEGPGLSRSAVAVTAPLQAGTATYTASHAHDGDGLLEAVAVDAGAGAFATLDVTPHPDHGLLSATEIVAGVTVTSSLTPNGFGEPASLGYAWSEGATAHGLDFAYTYDGAGRIEEVLETRTTGATPTARALTYEYDSVGRLTEVYEGSTREEAYAYDANGNRTQWENDAGLFTGALYDDRDRLIEYTRPDATVVSFTYDSAGRLATRSEGGSTVATYRYDALGNLLEATVGSTTVSYTVDGRGRRVARRVDGLPTHFWLYQGGLSPVAELDGNGHLRRVFVYGTAPHSPDLVVDVEPSNGATVATWRVLRDHLGSPRALVNVADGSHTEVRFDAYGRVVAGSLGDLAVSFAGGIPDPLTGLIRFGARDYDPETGRWTAPDPILWGGGLTNLYSYVGGDPVNRRDPTGLSDVSDYLYLWWSVTYSGLPNIVGTVVGVIGSGTDVGIGPHNTLEFYGNDIINLVNPGGATTFGHVICYGSQAPSDGMREHEYAHVRQSDVLGPVYLQAHVAAQAWSHGLHAAFGDTSKPGGTHPYSAYNPLEWGPYSDPPVPWSW